MVRGWGGGGRGPTRARGGYATAFCVETLKVAMARHGKPDIFNTDQGSQFTGSAFTSVLATNGITICMDGKGAWRDNVFVERLWRRYPMLALRSAATWTFIMGGVHTRVSTAPRPIKPTSPRCHSAWQPNPGRGSTYRRGKSVQTTGTTSWFDSRTVTTSLSLTGRMTFWMNCSAGCTRFSKNDRT
jgi:hypothetical protein